jgi:membrane protein DedA with SNARE-associated domain
MGRLIWAVGIGCAIYVIYDVWTNNKRLTDGQKLLWTIAALLFNIVTAIVYYLTQKR